MSCRCVFDFAAISREGTRRTLRRRRPRRLAPELPLLRAPPRAPRRRWTRYFLASSRKTRGSVVFRFSQVLPRWRFVSCELGRALCRAPVSTQCGALESPGGAPARRGVAGHTPAPACASARGPRSRMRRTRGSTDRTHSAFALAITATRSRPRERVLVFPRFDERLAQNAKRKDFSLSFVCFRCFRGRRAARNGSSRGSDAFLLTPIRLSL